MGGGFLPVGGAEAGLDSAWLGIAGLGGPSTTRAVLQWLGRGLLGLTLQGLVEQFTTQYLTELHDQLFEIGEGSAPRKALGSVDVVK
jgi:hypothetical protein